MPEAGLWQYLRGVLPPEGHYSRVESEVGFGIPDFNYAIPGNDQVYEGWVELKSQERMSEHPFRSEGLRSTQIDWIRERLSVGGRVSVIARLAERVIILQGWKCLRLNESNPNDLMRLCTAYFDVGDPHKRVTELLRETLTHYYLAGKPHEARSSSVRRPRNYEF